MDSEIISKYFPNLTPRQKEQFDMLGDLYRDWNTKINVISRRDIDNLYPNHVLHSLAIAAFLQDLSDGTTLVDIGTGGGFPGIPLAIMYPQCRFHLVDRIGKKITVARDVAGKIGLQNVTLQHGDMGECHQTFDYVVSRAVMPLADLVKVTRRNVKPEHANSHTSGLICLKGGDLAEELEAAKMPVMEIPVTDWFPEAFFEEKSLIYVPYFKK